MGVSLVLVGGRGVARGITLTKQVIKWEGAMYTSCKIYEAITTFLKERIQNIETSSLAITQMVAPKHSPRVGTENWASVP